MRFRAALLPAGLAIAIAAGAVRAAPELVDRIIAIVGTEIILASEVDEEVFLAQLQERLDPKDEEAVRAYREQILEALIEAKILYEKARAEGIRASREEVDEEVRRMIDDIRAQFLTEEEFEAQLAAEQATIDDLWATYRTRVEQQITVRKLVDRQVRSKVVVDEREARRYWDEHRAEIPPIPAGLTLRRILVRFQSDSVADSASVRRAEIVLRRLQNGEDFATLAKVFSEGPTAERGGDLGSFQLEDLAPRLAEAIEGLEAGELTPVVLTSRGAHILRVEERDDDGRVRLRQIVFLRDEAAARAAARARAEAILRRLRAGESFAELARAESDDPVSREQGGLVGEIPIESFAPKYRAALEPLEPGDISEILEDEEGLTIFRVEGKEGRRDPTYAEVHDRLIRLLEQQKAQELYREYLDKARQDVFVENRMNAES